MAKLNFKTAALTFAVLTFVPAVGFAVDTGTTTGTTSVPSMPSTGEKIKFPNPEEIEHKVKEFEKRLHETEKALKEFKPVLENAENGLNAAIKVEQSPETEKTLDAAADGLKKLKPAVDALEEVVGGAVVGG